MEPLPGVWPIDLEKWESMTLGSGDYSVGWTSARDVSKASTKLVDAEKWVSSYHTLLIGLICG